MDGVIAEERRARAWRCCRGRASRSRSRPACRRRVVAASRELATAEEVQAAFSRERFRVYTSDDVTGVAIGGALKNVMAIAVGFSDGLGFGSNARAALITRGLARARAAWRRSSAAHPLTLAGLAGLGDLVLTCTGELSRNRQVGLALARGETLPAILAGWATWPRGSVRREPHAIWRQRLGIDMPITHLVAAVVHEGKPAREGVAELLARESKAERG